VIKTASWTPFAAHGMTVEQTRAMILWAMAQWGVVCGLQIVSSKGGKADISIRGVATDKWAGYAQGNNVSISMIRNMTGRDGFVLGGVVMHEIGHTLGLKHTPQTDAYRFDLMHPWGPSDDWPSVREVLSFQKKWKLPSKDFHVHEITYWGNKLKQRRKEIDALLAKKESLLAEREKAIDAGNQKKVAALTAQIEAVDKPLGTFRATQRGWKSIYSQAVERWTDKNVPRAIVPNITRAERKLAEQAEFNPITIGSTCCGFGTDEFTPKQTKLEPI